MSHAKHLEQILHDIHEAHDVHYTPVGELADVVASHLPNDTGVSVSDILTAIWDWRMSNRPTSFRVGYATLSVEQVSSTAWDVFIVYDNDIKAPRRVTITNLEMVNTIIGHVTADQEAMKRKENTTAL